MEVSISSLHRKKHAHVIPLMRQIAIGYTTHDRIYNTRFFNKLCMTIQSMSLKYKVRLVVNLHMYAYFRFPTADTIA